MRVPFLVYSMLLAALSAGNEFALGQDSEGTATEILRLDVAPITREKFPSRAGPDVSGMDYTVSPPARLQFHPRTNPVQIYSILEERQNRRSLKMSARFPDPIELESMRVKRYQEYLRAFQELPLKETSSNSVKKLRFFWLRAFNNPICVRVEMEDGISEGASITVKELDGCDLFDLPVGKLVTARQGTLSKVQLEVFLKAADTASFWKMAEPTEQQKIAKFNVRSIDDVHYNRNQYEALDSQWIIEEWNSGRYRMVTKVMPEKSTFRDLGLTLLDIGEIIPQNLLEVY